MKKYLLAFLAITLFSCTHSSYAASNPIDLEGSYECGGSEVDTNESFTCQTTIAKTNQTYVIKSACNDNTFYVGTGIYDKEKQVLSLAFTNPNKKEETGIALVHVKSNHKFKSVWTYLNKTTTAQGYCTKQIKPT